MIFLVTFVIPLFGLTAYELMFATDRFDSTAAVVISTERASVPSLDLSALGLAAPEAQRDPLILTEFVESSEMLQYLDAKLDLRGHYSNPEIDWWSRLPPNYALEDFHDYMRNYLRVSFDTASQILTLHVEAFDRQYAQKIVNAVLERSQEFTDRLNDKVTSGQTKFFEDQLVETEQRLRQAKADLLGFQNQNRIMTTESEAMLVTSNIAELEKSLLARQGELETKIQVLAEDAPTIQILRTEIATIQMQINQEKDRLSGGTGAAVNELDAKFREIQFNIEFITNIYKSNLAQLEASRVAAVQRLKYLVVVTQPTLADSSLYPKRGFILGSAAMILFMVFFIVSLIIAIIREHV